jgi:hypothetical protein
MSFNPANSFLPILGGLPFGFGGSGFPVTQDAVTFTTEPVAPQEGVRRQDVTTNLGMYGPFPPYDGYAGPHYGVCGFPGNVTGFDPAPALSVPIMWRMRAEPAIVLASFYLTFAPACSAGWSSEIVDDGGDPELAEVVKAAHAQDLLPIWYRAFPASLECLHFANWLQEIVWGRREDRGGAGAKEGANPAQGGFRVLPIDVRPVLPMEALLHRDDYLRFAGFQIGPEFRGPAYAFLAVNQPHLDPVRGYSRNQNALKDWWRAQQSELNADRTERKASGIHMMLGVPTGNFTSTKPDGTTETITGFKMAQNIADQAARANVFTTPRSMFTKDEIRNKPELADIPFVKVEKFDWGNIGESLASHLKRLDRLEVNMVRAWHHGEREGMEAEHGSRADATAHKSGGILDPEAIRSMLACQWDDQVGATWQRQNFPQWQGKICTKPDPLSDPMQEFLQEIAKTLLGSPTTGPDTELELDRRANLDRVGLALRKPEDVDKDRQQLADDKEKQQQQQAAAAKANGNGLNGQAKVLAKTAKRVQQYLD